MSNRLPVALIVLGALVTPIGARAQTPDLLFRRLSSDAGLSHNSVFAFTQDAEGFLWIGTADGLNRYDGYEFRVYRHDPGDSTSLSNNHVNALHTDSAGVVWVATGNGLSRLDPIGDAFRRYSLHSAVLGRQARTVSSLLKSRDGSLWVGTDAGLFRHDRPADAFVAVYPLVAPGQDGDARIGAVKQDPAGNIWVLTGDVGSWTVRAVDDSASGQSYVMPERWREVFFDDFLIDAGGRFWFASDGPATLAGATKQLRLPGIEGLFPSPAWASLQGRDGTVWIGTGSGVLRVDPDGGGATFHTPERARSAYVFNFVRALYEDRSGTLWVGTHGGVYQLDPHAKPFRHLSGDPTRPHEEGGAVSAVYESAGVLWLGALGTGLTRVDRRTGASRTFRHAPGDHTSLRDNVVWAIHGTPDGTIWVGTGGGLSSLDPRGTRFRRHDLPLAPGVPNQPPISSIAEDGSGSLWLTGSNALFRFDPVTRRARRYDLGPPNGDAPAPVVESALVADSGIVWLGMAPGALVRLDTASGAIERHALEDDAGKRLESAVIWALHRTADGMLWLGGASVFSRFDPRTANFRHYYHLDGLPGSVVYSILGDRAGHLWLGTNRGLARFDPAAPPNRAFRNFSRADGLGNTEFNRHAAFASASGEFFFGGIDGVTSFLPQHIGENAYVPPVVFTRIETARRGGVRSHNPRGLGSLALSYRDYSLSFDFAALSYTNPEQNRYAYFLDGFDRAWVDAGTRRFARYTNIPPGEYTLRVRGSNNDGVWNEAGTVLAISVAPPFWVTTWFRLAVLVLLASAAAAAYRLRVARLLEIERLRLRIAGDLHDDLSSNLSGIAIVGEMLHRKATIGPEERGQLARLSATARQMVDDLRDIVWLVDPARDRLDDLVLRMRDVASTLLPGVGISFHSDAQKLEAPLSLSFRRQIFLMYKEILHNVARHALASTVSINVAQADRTFALSIADDGVGFDMAEHGGGFGIASLRRRAAEMGGVIEISTRSGGGGGTRVDVRVPIT